MIAGITRELGLPGQLALRIGSAADYRKLARFHYLQSSPASFALTMALDYQLSPLVRRVVAVGVLSHPPLNCAARNIALNLGRVPPQWRWTYLNRHLRTISRVIVHPEFRGVGLSVAIIRALLAQSPTRYTEAIARMGTAHPLFARAGLSMIHPGDACHPAYYLLDRLAGNASCMTTTRFPKLAGNVQSLHPGVLPARP